MAPILRRCSRIGRSWRFGLPPALALGLAGLWPAPVLPQPVDSISVVRGQVFEHESGNPLAGAAVSLAAGPGGTGGIGTRVTNSGGVFLFRDVPSGTYRIIVTLLGYRDLRDTLQVQGETTLDLSLPMSISPIVLEPLVVVSERRPLGPLRDFEERRRTRIGTFLDREDIEERNPLLFSDIFRMVPGARVVPTGPLEQSILLRGGCRPTLWVDGARLMTSEGADHFLQTMDLEAVEVYHSSSVPVEFGTSSCGVIVVWTKRGEPTMKEGSFWKRLGVAAGLLLLAFLATG
ncbi:MAG: TonB-dependent receptor [Gemmatimonadota bacterium]